MKDSLDDIDFEKLDCPRCMPENYKGISRFPVERVKCPHCQMTYTRQKPLKRANDAGNN